MRFDENQLEKAFNLAHGKDLEQDIRKICQEFRLGQEISDRAISLARTFKVDERPRQDKVAATATMGRVASGKLKGKLLAVLLVHYADTTTPPSSHALPDQPRRSHAVATHHEATVLLLILPPGSAGHMDRGQIDWSTSAEWLNRARAYWHGPRRDLDAVEAVSQQPAAEVDAGLVELVCIGTAGHDPRLRIGESASKRRAALRDLLDAPEITLLGVVAEDEPALLALHARSW